MHHCSRKKILEQYRAAIHGEVIVEEWIQQSVETIAALNTIGAKLFEDTGIETSPVKTGEGIDITQLRGVYLGSDYHLLTDGAVYRVKSSWNR